MPRSGSCGSNLRSAPKFTRLGRALPGTGLGPSACQVWLLQVQLQKEAKDQKLEAPKPSFLLPRDLDHSHSD